MSPETAAGSPFSKRVHKDTEVASQLQHRKTGARKWLFRLFFAIAGGLLEERLRERKA
jgi:hypothetical protein